MPIMKNSTRAGSIKGHTSLLLYIVQILDLRMLCVLKQIFKDSANHQYGNELEKEQSLLYHCTITYVYTLSLAFFLPDVANCAGAESSCTYRTASISTVICRRAMINCHRSNV